MVFCNLIENIFYFNYICKKSISINKKITIYEKCIKELIDLNHSIEFYPGKILTLENHYLDPRILKKLVKYFIKNSLAQTTFE